MKMCGFPITTAAEARKLLSLRLMRLEHLEDLRARLTALRRYL